MYNHTAYEAYIHSLLEPGEVIHTGNYKEHKPVRIAVIKPPEPVISEDEDNRRQDAYVNWAQNRSNSNS